MSRVPLASVILFVVAGVLLLLALPCVGMGVLGLVGVLADVSPAENREFGWQFIALSAIPAGLGVLTLVLALLIRRAALASPDEAD